MVLSPYYSFLYHDYWDYVNYISFFNDVILSHKLSYYILEQQFAQHARGDATATVSNALFALLVE